MQITTATTTIYTIQLTDADMGEILADPTAFQADLRVRRNTLAKDRAVASGRKKRDLVIAPKVKAADGRSYPNRQRPEKKPCPKCGRMLSPQGLARHIPTCRGSIAD